jgi:hypothetical protein
MRRRLGYGANIACFQKRAAGVAFNYLDACPVAALESSFMRMADIKKTYVNLGIRPLTVVFALWGISRLLHRDWLNGAVLIAGWVAVSVIGYDVGKPSEMLKGDDAHLMSKGATKIMLVCFRNVCLLVGQSWSSLVLRHSLWLSSRLSCGDDSFGSAAHSCENALNIGIAKVPESCVIMTYGKADA